MLRLTSFLACATTSLALTFTSPFSGSTVDLTSPLKVTWVPGPSDPSTFTLEIVNTVGGNSDGSQILGLDVQTSSGSYTVPANTISNYGDGFELYAMTSGGQSIGNSGSFSLADGVYSLQTSSNGVLIPVTISTQGSGPSATSAESAPTTAAGSGAPASSTSSDSGKSSSKATGAIMSSTASASSSSNVQPFSTMSQSSSSTSSHAAAASSSSDSNSNLGFSSAANAVCGSVVISCAAFLGALVVLTY